MNTVSLLQNGRRWLLGLIVVACFATTLFAFPEFIEHSPEAAADTSVLAFGGRPGLGGGG